MTKTDLNFEVIMFWSVRRKEYKVLVCAKHLQRPLYSCIEISLVSDLHEFFVLLHLSRQEISAQIWGISGERRCLSDI